MNWKLRQHSLVDTGSLLSSRGGVYMDNKFLMAQILSNNSFYYYRSQLTMKYKISKSVLNLHQ